MCVTSGQRRVRVVRLPGTLSPCCSDPGSLHWYRSETWSSHMRDNLPSKSPDPATKQKGDFSSVKPLRFGEYWFPQRKLFDSTNTEARENDVSSVRVRPFTIPCHTRLPENIMNYHPIYWGGGVGDGSWHWKKCSVTKELKEHVPMPLAEEITWGRILNTWKLN